MVFLKTGVIGGGRSEGLTYVDVGGNIGSCSVMMAGTKGNHNPFLSLFRWRDPTFVPLVIYKLYIPIPIYLFE